MSFTHYILRDGVPVEEPDFLTWAEWFEHADRCVLEQTTVDGVLVSTVFLGFDHATSRDGPPVLFESMVFGGDRDGEQRRYRTFDEARAGHAGLVAIERAVGGKAVPRDT